MRCNQKGFAVLGVSLVLMLLGSLAVLFSSKIIFYSQKTANNTYHFSQASAAAQAGIEQGLSFLSNTTTGTIKRSDLYDASTSRLISTQFPINGALTKSRSSYTISMLQPNVTNDPMLILIQATGCGDGCTKCTVSCPVQTKVSQLVRFRPLALHAPDDALLARGDIGIGGSVTVENTSGVGVAVHAGGSVAVTGGSATTGGTGQYDNRLAATTPNDYFAYFFGATRELVKSQIPNYANTFPPSGTVGGAYWIEGDTQEHGGTYGSPTSPVVLIVNGNLEINANTTIYGMVYVVGGGLKGWSNSGGGNAQIVGAAISEASFASTGNLDIKKDPSVLLRLTGVFSPAKVVGGWKDF